MDLFLINTFFFKKYKSYYSNNTYAYIMNKINSIDIDDFYDFKIQRQHLYKEFINIKSFLLRDNISIGKFLSNISFHLVTLYSLLITNKS